MSTASLVVETSRKLFLIASEKLTNKSKITPEVDSFTDIVIGLCSIVQLRVQVLSLIRIESSVPGVLEQLPRSVVQKIVFVRDATGREYKLLVDQCWSRNVSCFHQT